MHSGISRRAREHGRVVLLVAAAVLSAGCSGADPWGRRVDPSGVHTAAVDSEAARLALADVRWAPAEPARLDVRAEGPLTDVFTGVAADSRAPWIPDAAWLRDLAASVSTDYAALTFARIVGADDRSRRLQAAFDRFTGEALARAEERLRAPRAFPYTVLLAPAWLYRTHPESGADFARQRRVLERLGVAHRLIAAAESGSVEDNAAIVAEAVREARRRAETILLISASKSGAEVALALSRLLAPEEADHVRGWLNVVGALGGTPLVDQALQQPIAWFARALFRLTGWDWAGPASMATEPSRRRLQGARLPASIAVVNLIAVPLSGTVGRRVYGGYLFLRDHGPNDGVVLLADTVWPGGANIVVIGADHLLASGQDDARDLALLRVMDAAVRGHDPSPPPSTTSLAPSPRGDRTPPVESAGVDASPEVLVPTLF
jgi:hypothetical protein